MSLESNLPQDKVFAHLLPERPTACFKVLPEDFFVEECLGFSFTGEGEHVFLKLEKQLLTTLAVQGIIAKWANVPRKQVAYSGLKDKHAITQQWFSVYLPGKATPEPDALESMAAIKVVDCVRHQKKLRIGAHKENYFSLVLRDIDKPQLLENNLQKIASMGVPNYFGEQRFGHNRNNLQVAKEVFLLKSKKLKRHQEGIYLSAIRSFIFNLILSQRVDDATWNQYQTGDIVQLHGSHSCFMPDVWDDVLQARLLKHDLHLTATLIGAESWQVATQQSEKQGDDNQVDSQNQRVCEQSVLNAFPEWARFFTSKMKAVRRSMRVVPREITWQWLQDDTLRLNFYLPAGSFATAVLRELIDVKQAHDYQRL